MAVVKQKMKSVVVAVAPSFALMFGLSLFFGNVVVLNFVAHGMRTNTID